MQGLERVKVTVTFLLRYFCLLSVVIFELRTNERTNEWRHLLNNRASRSSVLFEPGSFTSPAFKLDISVCKSPKFSQRKLRKMVTEYGKPNKTQKEINSPTHQIQACHTCGHGPSILQTVHQTYLLRTDSKKQ